MKQNQIPDVYHMYHYDALLPQIDWNTPPYNFWKQQKLWEPYERINQMFQIWALPSFGVWRDISNSVRQLESLNNYANLSNAILTYVPSLIHERTLSLWANDITTYLNEETYQNFLQNVEAALPFIQDESLTIDEEEIKEELNNDKEQKKSKEFIKRVFRGTLTDDDYKDNKFATYMMRVILWIVICISNKLLDTAYESAKKAIQVNYLPHQEEVTQIDYENYRLVTADVLNVRKKPSTESDIMGSLKCFNVVRIIEEVPYWYKVEYIDLANDVSIKGWIAKRYTEGLPSGIEKSITTK